MLLGVRSRVALIHVALIHVALQAKGSIWLFLDRCSHQKLPSDVRAIHNIPQGQLTDLRAQVKESIETIRQMEFLHSDVGRGRAWIRLCLERKCLSNHINTILLYDDSG